MSSNRRTGGPEEALENMRGTVVLVLGDVMVDRYILGKVCRISPEAPVPVVEVEGESLRLGGAANVANNIRTLGGHPLLCGVVGDDTEGVWLRRELKRLGMTDDGICIEAGGATTVKTRIMAHHQQVVRYDRERKGPLGKMTERSLAEKVRKLWNKAKGTVVSDYAKGVVSPVLMDCVRTCSENKKRIPVAVDPKAPSFRLYRKATVLTPNLSEAMGAAFPAGGGTMLEAGRKIISLAGAAAVLVTRGEEGMTLFERRKKPYHIPTDARNVYDVTGAGDTVIAALSLGIASGLEMREAARIANAAAGSVVSELGTVPVDLRAVEEALGIQETNSPGGARR